MAIIENLIVEHPEASPRLRMVVADFQTATGIPGAAIDTMQTFIGDHGMSQEALKHLSTAHLAAQDPVASTADLTQLIDLELTEKAELTKTGKTTWSVDDNLRHARLGLARVLLASDREVEARRVLSAVVLRPGEDVENLVRRCQDSEMED